MISLKYNSSFIIECNNNDDCAEGHYCKTTEPPREGICTEGNIIKSYGLIIIRFFVFCYYLIMKLVQ